MEEQKSPTALRRSWNKMTSAFQRKSNPKKTPHTIIGIEDIDFTWEFAALGDYNAHMDETFEEKEITDHWLCSDMRFDDREMESREHLETHMQKRNHKLLGIITSADYAWHLDEQTLLNFREACTHPDIDFDLNLNKNLDKLAIVLGRPEFESIQKLLKGEETALAHQAAPRTAYSVVKEAYLAVKNNPKQENSDAFEKLKLRGRAAKFVLDLICAGFGSETVLEDGSVKREARAGIKGLMLRSLLMQDQPEDISYAFFDDKLSEVKAVIYESAETLKTRISAFESPTKKDPNYTKEYYVRCIEKHLAMVTSLAPTPTKPKSHITRRRASSITSVPTAHQTASAPVSRGATPPSPMSTSASADDLSGLVGLKLQKSSAPK
ncbi:MAG TPA: hypothetical protein VGV92_08665 [Gammaproteobacteria bacterium]|nr:hypothetical protein [Gammaproteobacteria bacterium]